MSRRAMMYKVYAAFLMSLGIALALPPARPSAGRGQSIAVFLLRRIQLLSIDHSRDRTASDAIEAISFRETSFGEETSFRDSLTNPTQTSRHRYQARSQTIQITPANLIFPGIGHTDVRPVLLRALRNHPLHRWLMCPAAPSRS